MRFWAMTPWETRKVVEAEGRRRKRDRDLAISTAWHSEMFARQKHLQPLRHYIGGPAEQPQSLAEQWANFKAFAARGRKAAEQQAQRTPQ